MSKSFVTRSIALETDKLKKGKRLRLVFLSDLHGRSFGWKNELLIEAVRNLKPDLILCGGDLITRRRVRSYKRGAALLRSLRRIAPVYYAFGNHESAMARMPFSRRFLPFVKKMKRSGVRLLRNQKVNLRIRGMRLCLCGLEIPHDCYQKPFPAPFKAQDLTGLFGEADKERFTILLAHSPYFARSYFDWGADLTLSGHYHGGVLRFSEHIGAVSPYFHPFPRYCCGQFEREGKNLIVSAGLGEHSIPLRLHNPRELIGIDIQGMGR